MNFRKMFTKWYTYGGIASLFSILLLGIYFNCGNGAGVDVSGGCFLLILSFLPAIALTPTGVSSFLEFWVVSVLVILQFFILGSLIGLVIIRIRRIKNEKR